MSNRLTQYMDNGHTSSWQLIILVPMRNRRALSSPSEWYRDLRVEG